MIFKYQARTMFAWLIIVLPFVHAECGYKSCNPTQPDKLNVHLVPHTHDDVGWLKTVDQYYYGANNSIQHAGVQYIIDSVISELDKDPERRFIYVEIAFFERWWREQTETTQAKVKSYVNAGRLEFINGGWSMNDEACTHYNSIIDQMTIGHRFLKDNFGDCGIPKIAWHIDPFGHSREQASLFAQMGFDGFYFARIDYGDRKYRKLDLRMEAIWEGDSSLGKSADLHFGVLYGNLYTPPTGFCFDQGCNDQPMQDDKTLFDYNVDERVDAFINWVTLQSLAFKTNHIMLTMGSDFQYENANAWYKNLDKLMKYVNEKSESSGIYTLYSTPSCYTYNLNNANKTWSTKKQDFFPYADSPHSQWTGYFVSRVAFKGNERRSNNLLQVCKQLEALAGDQSKKDPEAEVQTLREYMGISQHHDSITGTAKQHVNDDYTKRLHIGNGRCEKVVGLALGQLMAKNKTIAAPRTEFCHYLNISICSVTESPVSFNVLVYNPLARDVTTFVQIPVNGNSYKVIGPDGSSTPSQIEAVSDAIKRVRGYRGTAKNNIVFPVTIPALGFSTYQVSSAMMAKKPINSKSFSENVKAIPVQRNSDTTIKNDMIGLTFDTNGLLKSMTSLKSNITINIKQSFYWYNASTGNEEASQASGAYIFRPNSSTAFDIFNGTVKGKVVTGSQFSEYQQTFQPWLSQNIRLYKGANFAEFEWIVGPIPFKDGLGKEIISRFDTDIDSEEIFYTDANGRQIMTRQRNHREDYPYVNLEPVSGNYYPINSRISIQGGSKQFTIMTDRSAGGSSLSSGSVEIMVHRRLLHDDGRGVGEPLNETGQFGDGLMVVGKQRILLSKSAEAPAQHRILGEEIYMAPWVFFSSETKDWNKKYNNMQSFIRSNLPANVHLLTLELWSNSEILLRLEHQFEKNEDPALSKNVTVSLQGLFPLLNIKNVDEMTLSVNQNLTSASRLQWRTKSGVTPTKFSPPPAVSPSFDVLLNAMEIRTFVATFSRS